MVSVPRNEAAVLGGNCYITEFALQNFCQTLQANKKIPALDITTGAAFNQLIRTLSSSTEGEKSMQN